MPSIVRGLVPFKLVYDETNAAVSLIMVSYLEAERGHLQLGVRFSSSLKTTSLLRKDFLEVSV